MIVMINSRRVLLRSESRVCLTPHCFPHGATAARWRYYRVLLCFAAFTGLSHAFVHEEETGTTLALRLSMPATAVYAGKLLFNLMLITMVTVIVTPFYMLITGMGAGTRQYSQVRW